MLAMGRVVHTHAHLFCDRAMLNEPLSLYVTQLESGQRMDTWILWILDPLVILWIPDTSDTPVSHIHLYV